MRYQRHDRRIVSWLSYLYCREILYITHLARQSSFWNKSMDVRAIQLATNNDQKHCYTQVCLFIQRCIFVYLSLGMWLCHTTTCREGPNLAEVQLGGISPMVLTHWGRDKMAANSQTTFSNTFSWIKMCEYWFELHWIVFLRVQLTIFQHWLQWWFGANQVTSHYLNQCCLVYWCIHASLGLNELKFSPERYSLTAMKRTVKSLI